MKNLTVFVLIFLISFVYSFEGIQLLTELLGDQSQYSWLSIENCEEGSSSDPRGEHDEAKFTIQINSSAQLLSLQTALTTKEGTLKNCFRSADYSQVVYSPPERLV